MLITPTELKEYSEFDSVKERSNSLLEHDILEAEVAAEEIVGHDFAEYSPLPPKAKLAILKLSQFYALINSDESIVKGYKSEKMGDYSYTLSDGNTLNKPDVSGLLKEYIQEGTAVDNSKTANLRMRSI
jgi:hypothetical protein